MFNHYFQKLRDLLDIVEKDEKEKIKKAAQKVSECVQHDGIIHLFGCGHSHMIGEELFYRAGGLAPISPILIEDVMLHKGAVRSSQLEKQQHFAEQFMIHDRIHPEDVVIVVSTSGRNPVPIDVAEIAKKQGAFVIAITSPSYAKSQSSRHENGQYLYSSVDLSIDNHIEVGDALMTQESLDIAFGSGSTVISMAIANGIMVEAVKIMLENDFIPPIFKSGNIDGAEEHNRELINKYKSRIPMLEV
ncbi:SIS domain-containing protein [Domibacillus mangrovi]|uniref:UPF0309 protein BLL40_15425 n=1 Tax=Domibacillus mangrovi TaxID=1714354 RepID=A0A1Q5NZJ5_9BACI|nr:SIS domain-containing protein [Domibacillus mangrovi]OKL35437.1 hypothetical protein BLL40_15425 [Domibacillus mangrovi]